jgi:putative NADH-flavin reductase
MKLIIFGATGNTGRQIVKQALNEGHTVTAFARNPTKLIIKHSNLEIVKGDIMDVHAVEMAVRGHDAVLSAIGDGEKRSTLRKDGTRNIMRAMSKTGVRRLISISTIGVRDTKTMLPALYKYLLVPFVLKHAFADHAKQEEYIEQSELDWIIVRPAALTNGPYTGIYQHGFSTNQRGLKLKISRADVAAFMLKQISDRKYIRKMPGLSY